VLLALPPGAVFLLVIEAAMLGLDLAEIELGPFGLEFIEHGLGDPSSLRLSLRLRAYRGC